MSDRIAIEQRAMELVHQQTSTLWQQYQSARGGNLNASCALPRTVMIDFLLHEQFGETAITQYTALKCS